MKTVMLGLGYQVSCLMIRISHAASEGWLDFSLRLRKTCAAVGLGQWGQLSWVGEQDIAEKGSEL